MILMMIYHVDGNGDEDKHNLRRRKYVTCIKRKVGINFAQVTKLYLPNDDDDMIMRMMMMMMIMMMKRQGKFRKSILGF